MEFKKENYHTEYEDDVIKTMSLEELNDAVDYAIRIANKNNKCPCDIPVYITKNGKKYQVKDYNFGIAFGHEINVFIDFNEYNVIEYVAPDSRPEEGEYWRSRGTGVGSDGVADCSGFVVSKLAGERLRRMVRLVLESDDTKSYLEAIAFPIPPDMAAVIFLDRTKLKRSDNALRRRQRQLRTLGSRNTFRCKRQIL